MLVLSRKVGERIWVGDGICITVVRLTSGGVRLGIEAPAEMPVIREELKLRQQAESAAAQVVEGIADLVSTAGPPASASGQEKPPREH